MYTGHCNILRMYVCMYHHHHGTTDTTHLGYEYMTMNYLIARQNLKIKTS